MPQTKEIVRLLDADTVKHINTVNNEALQYIYGNDIHPTPLADGFRLEVASWQDVRALMQVGNITNASLEEKFIQRHSNRGVSYKFDSGYAFGLRLTQPDPLDDLVRAEVEAMGIDPHATPIDKIMWSVRRCEGKHASDELSAAFRPVRDIKPHLVKPPTLLAGWIIGNQGNKHKAVEFRHRASKALGVISASKMCLRKPKL